MKCASVCVLRVRISARVVSHGNLQYIATVDGLPVERDGDYQWCPRVLYIVPYPLIRTSTCERLKLQYAHVCVCVSE